MNLTSIKKYRKRLEQTTGLFQDNPILSMGLCLPFVIVPTLTLRSGLLMSILLAVATIPVALLAPILSKKLSPLLLLPCSCVLSLCCIALFRKVSVIPAALVEGLGVYISLAAINGIFLEVAVVHPRPQVTRALVDSVLLCFCFTLPAFCISVCR